MAKGKDYSHEFDVLNQYIAGLEREAKLRDRIIESQKEIIAHMEKYQHELEAVIDEFPSLVEDL